MTKKRDLGQELLQGIRDIKSGKGKVITINAPDDIKHLRDQLHLSQMGFAAFLGVSIKTLQDWEQGRRSPRGAARSLLQIAAQHPEVFNTHYKTSNLHNKSNNH